MATKRELEYQNFDLQKVKVTKDGIETTYLEKGAALTEHTIKSEGQPHPDLTNAIEELNKYAADRIMLLEGVKAYKAAVKDNLDEYAIAMKLEKETIERFKASGISYTGRDQLLAVKITGSVKCEIGSYGMATPNITFASEKLGYEKEVLEITERIKKEAYLYHFKSKRAQQDLVTQANEADEANAAAEEAKLKD